VRGASKGEGLGNQFLANIREVDAVAHVLRCFADDDITHVEGRIDPIGDAETVETELMLADLDSVEKRLPALEKKAKGGEKEAKEALALVMKAVTLLRDGKPARLADLTPEERGPYSQLGLMTSKPVLYVLNVEEASAAHGNAISPRRRRWPRSKGAKERGDLGQDRGRDRADVTRGPARFPGLAGAGGAWPQSLDPRRL
jgi:ribosome-binding ATPase YchF (GTP1/OBG family)